MHFLTYIVRIYRALLPRQQTFISWQQEEFFAIERYRIDNPTEVAKVEAAHAKFRADLAVVRYMVLFNQ